MASTILVKDVLWQIGVLMVDTDPQFYRFKEFDIVEFLSDGQEAICTILPTACTRIDAIRLKAGTRQSIGTILAADCLTAAGTSPSGPIYGKQLIGGVMRNMGTTGTTPGQAVRLVERDVKDAANPNWHAAAAGTVVREFVYDSSTPRDFYVSPPVPAGRLWVEFPYAASPRRITNTGTEGSPRYLKAGTATDVLEVDDEWSDALKDYVCARLHLTESKYTDRNKYPVHAARFLAFLNAKTAAMTGKNPNLTVLPGVQPPP